MESPQHTPERLSPEAALSGVLALLIEERRARPSDARSASLEALLARAGLTSREIGLVTGQTPDAVDARLNEPAHGPALWSTIQRQRLAMPDADAAPKKNDRVATKLGAPACAS